MQAPSEHETGVDVSGRAPGRRGLLRVPAAVMAVAAVHPGKIRSMIEPVGTTRTGARAYAVTFPWLGRLIVDDRFYFNVVGDTQYAAFGDLSGARETELWPKLVEKAWAAARGGYQKIHRGDTRDALLHLTGSPATRHDLPRPLPTEAAAQRALEDKVLKDIGDALATEQPVTAGTGADKPGDMDRLRALGSSSFVSGHARAIGVHHADRTINVLNPQGKHAPGFPVKAFTEFFTDYANVDLPMRAAVPAAWRARGDGAGQAQAPAAAP